MNAVQIDSANSPARKMALTCPSLKSSTSYHIIDSISHPCSPTYTTPIYVRGVGAPAAPRGARWLAEECPSTCFRQRRAELPHSRAGSKGKQSISLYLEGDTKNGRDRARGRWSKVYQRVRVGSALQSDVHVRLFVGLLLCWCAGAGAGAASRWCFPFFGDAPWFLFGDQEARSGEGKRK